MNKEIINTNTENKNNETFLTQKVETQIYSGPIPHPNIIAAYKDLKEEYADQIFLMAKKEQEIREKQLENEDINIKNIVDSNFILYKRGQLFAFSLSLLCIISGFSLGYLGKENLAMMFVGTSLATIIYGFLRKEPKKDNLENEK